MAKKAPKSESLLETAAQKIGTTLGELAVKTGIAKPDAKAKSKPKSKPKAKSSVKPPAKGKATKKATRLEAAAAKRARKGTTGRGR
jgi:hypothetical protein